MKSYIETFDNGSGGWFSWASNTLGPKPLEIKDSVATSRSPWWIDYNHAPPGAGYLHLPFILLTRGPLSEHYMEVGGRNAFIEGGFPTNFTNARMTLRIKGELEARGAELVLLVQSHVGDTTSGWLLTGQPFRVTVEWSEQKITTEPDPGQWTCLGARRDRADYYGYIDLQTVLHNVNCDILLVLYPLNVMPMGPIDGDPHVLRAGKDYPVWQSRLPEGYIMLDEVRIDFP